MSRRSILRGVGAAVSLPVLEAMAPSMASAQTAGKAAAAAKSPVRVAFCFVPNGIDMEHWTPTADGAAFEIPKLLKPLEAHRENMTVFTGLTQQYAEANGDGPGDHARSAASWLTGVQARKTAGHDIQVGVSADQVAARYLGKQTRFASLEVGCERGAVAGECDSGYSCAYSSSISWRGPATPNPKEVNPRLVFERLFGAGGTESAESLAKRRKYQTSILDIVMEDATKLKGRLGARDGHKLDEYLTSVREIEQRIQMAEKDNANLALEGIVRPSGIPANFDEHIRLMADMLVLAFQTDQTRIATFMFANEASNRSYVQAGVNEGHHDMSHHGRDPYKLEKKQKIDEFHVKQLAYFIDRLSQVKELDGTLLDNSMIVYGAGISDGDRHNHDNLPIALFGKGGGKVKTGRHMRYPNRTPLNNLFLSVFERMGLPAEKLGDSTGSLLF